MANSDTRTQQALGVGLQAERTALAWNRTGLVVLVNALLALRTGWLSGEKFISTLALTLLVAAGAVILYGAWRRRQLLHEKAISAPPTWAMAATAIFTLDTCIASIAAILVY